jgi:hypothetical protein
MNEKDGVQWMPLGKRDPVECRPLEYESVAGQRTQVAQNGVRWTRSQCQERSAISIRQESPVPLRQTVRLSRTRRDELERRAILESDVLVLQSVLVDASGFEGEAEGIVEGPTSGIEVAHRDYHVIQSDSGRFSPAGAARSLRLS